MIEELLESLSKLEQVEAIAIGGSRATDTFDATSDYDIYLYVTDSIDASIRKEILSKYCSYMELGNHFWELEDNCRLQNGIDMDILYRNLDDFGNDVASVMEEYHAHNGYTTCMWYNLMTCKILYDQNNRLHDLKKRFNISYPKELRENIISQNMKLLRDYMPAYYYQIEKAVKRKDAISILHRTTAFFESYFDILFALNELGHPGEKRLISICLKECAILPYNFEENINTLLHDLYGDTNKIMQDIEIIIHELRKIL